MLKGTVGMTYIVHANLVLENGILWDGALEMEQGRIRNFGYAQELSIPEGASVIDAKGSYVGPGFVDLHVHGGNGHFLYREPEQAARHFLAHGETTILAALYYDLSKAEFCDAIARVLTAMHGARGASRAIAGFYMEGPYMNPKYGACAEKNKWRGEIQKSDYQAIVDAAGRFAKVWAVAPERDGLASFLEYAKSVNPDVTFAVGHSEATPEQIGRMKPYGLCLQTHCMDATGRINPYAGTRGCGPDEACLLDDDMYAELICDSNGIHVNPDLMRLILKVKGIDRTILITDSFVSEKSPAAEFQHIEDLVFDESGQLNGSRLTMNVACRNIMTHTNCGIAQAFRMASLNPARVIGMDRSIGSVARGKIANLVFVDDKFEVNQVILGGEIWKDE